MTSNIEGISAETMDKVAAAIYDTNQTLVTGMVGGHFVSNHHMDWDDCKKYKLDAESECRDAAQAAITVLLASGEVVLRKDTEELEMALRAARCDLLNELTFRGCSESEVKDEVAYIDEALAKFTNKQGDTPNA